MKTKILYQVSSLGSFRVEEVEIARSGKWIQLEGWRPSIRGLDWGAPSPELIAEAKAFNRDQEALRLRRRALLGKLKATQAGMLEAAAKVPQTPRTKPNRHVPLVLRDDQL